ncbi:PaaI family thioesterase [Nocardia panacis]|uniref:PaaI family thioesterase n=1 Tax=Nocardia panacis TaxID=2340916 RepID=A0A3A4KIE6_9NOCA|nr:PaaI family thioesterase [Nocardia panacis]RJO73473.1 PaaI family thioesterase [Nocardia panacis]
MTQQEVSENRALADALAELTPEGTNRLSAGTFTDEIGLRFTEVTPDRVRGELVVTPRLLQMAGIVNGGVYCTVIESLASIGGAVWYNANGNVGTVVGVNNNTDFLRAVRSGTLHGEATPLHRGRLQQLWVVVLTDDEGRTISRGQVRLQNLPQRD